VVLEHHQEHSLRMAVLCGYKNKNFINIQLSNLFNKNIIIIIGTYEHLLKLA